MQNDSRMTELTPREIVDSLDRYIIGQDAAKRAVAIALRNRWRRMQLEPAMRDEVMPKNILMIGPTGVGKTEIARRLAALAHAPFVKVEATRFTEVGYVGRDVEQIIRELADAAVKMLRDEAKARVRSRAEQSAEDRILDTLLPKRRGPGYAIDIGDADGSGSRNKLRRQLRDGELDDSEIELELEQTVSVDFMAPPGMEEMAQQMRQMFQGLAGSKQRARRLSVRLALPLLIEEEAARLVNEDEIRTQAIEACEQNGIVFLDEIDKVARRAESHGADVSREGVQRDLLPLVEGSTVPTKYGAVRTDHILFIASGAFHTAKPSDLIPELQGRFPIRVELAALSREDFRRILREPANALTRQYPALLATEGVDLRFTEAAIDRIADIAFEVNDQTENIGARRLHTALEKLLEEISFSASDRAGETLEIDEAFVDEHLARLAENRDLSRYIL